MFSTISLKQELKSRQNWYGNKIKTPIYHALCFNFCKNFLFRTKLEIDYFRILSKCFASCQISEVPRFHSKGDGTLSLFFGRSWREPLHRVFSAYVFSLLPIRDRSKMPKISSIHTSRLSNSCFSTTTSLNSSIQSLIDTSLPAEVTK